MPNIIDRFTIPKNEEGLTSARRPAPAGMELLRHFQRHSSERTGTSCLGPTGLRNLQAMHVLERIAAKLNDAGVPVLALKGAALHLTVYDALDQRRMDDIDLMVRMEHLKRTQEVFTQFGGKRENVPVSENFFPRFYYETGYLFGDVYPVKIDLHVRPFRPLRYGQFAPDDSLWEGARRVSIGRTEVFVPDLENMLIQLATHAAVHGISDGKWLDDIRLWLEHYGADLNWRILLDRVTQWRLLHPFRAGFRAAQRAYGAACPLWFDCQLERMKVNWRDRLALWHAPRDAERPAAQVFVNMLCTPGWRFKFSYFKALAWPHCPWGARPEC